MSTVLQKKEDIASNRLADIDGVVWDLDNTLYRVDSLMEQAFNLAIARAALATGVDLSLHEATEAARRSFYDHGYSGYVFVRDHGVNLKDLHCLCHDFLDEKIIARSQEMQNLFSGLALNHVLLTHSHRIWAQRVLDHIGLSAWFDSDRIFGLEDYDYRHKHECRSSFDMALAKLDCTPKTAIMVEDTMKNLRIPYDMGMVTVFIHHGRPPADLPDFVHISCAGTSDFLRLLAASQRSL